jgi:hydrogenase nickel incorporation protein HypA/HybF
MARGRRRETREWAETTSPSSHDMHELAIADALIEQVKREVVRAGQKGRVRRVELTVGRLTGVHCESLRFALELLSAGTLVEKAEVAITEPRAVCRCDYCHRITPIDEMSLLCPECGSSDVVIEGGRDLILESIELEEPESP